MISTQPLPLPVTWDECLGRGWTDLDILLITGDSYVDHPSFGIAIIGRVLEAEGYRVAILAQPRFDGPQDFSSFPAPRLFCGISAGNLDSVVANYTGNGRIRKTDAYSPGGSPWRTDTAHKKKRFRPDRATLLYSSLAKQAFPGVPVILGGIEASLRRFVHYDYQQDKLRNSFLTEAKADLLVYGMGERSVLEIAKRLQSGAALTGIGGTCERVSDKDLGHRYPEFCGRSDRYQLILPSWDEICATPAKFLESEIELDKHGRTVSRRLVFQRQKHQWVVQNPPQPILTSRELDRIYSLPYTRLPHPANREIPAFTMIRDSVTIVRGCCGNCSFCAITRHQGSQVVSRSHESILAEARKIASQPGFGGTITDLGGPTANLFGTSCTIGGCRRRDCLYPEICANLEIDETGFLKLLKDVSNIPKVRHLFISSGLRMGLLLETPQLLARILKHHTPGKLKIAPEHTVGKILDLMHKEPHFLLVSFVREVRRISHQLGIKPPQLSPYIITAHPGSTPDCAKTLVSDLKQLGLRVSSFQDFTPTPGTLSTAMYFSGLDPQSMRKIPVAMGKKERKREREILERAFQKPGKRQDRKR